MSHQFWETMRLFEREARYLARLNAETGLTMLDLKLRTKLAIDDSREVLCKADKVLARDGNAARRRLSGDGL